MYRDLTCANKALKYYEGTKIEALTQRKAKNNTSGVKGVSIKKNKIGIVYEASIQLAKKRIYKRFNSLDKAINWRIEQEDKLFKPLINKYRGELNVHIEEKIKNKKSKKICK